MLDPRFAKIFITLLLSGAILLLICYYLLNHIVTVLL